MTRRHWARVDTGDGSRTDQCACFKGGPPGRTRRPRATRSGPFTARDRSNCGNYFSVGSGAGHTACVMQHGTGIALHLSDGAAGHRTQRNLEREHHHPLNAKPPTHPPTGSTHDPQPVH